MSGVEGFAADYAFMIQALLDLYDASLERGWLEWAVRLQEIFDERYFDEERAGYLSVSEKEGILSIREDHDGAEPAPGSVAAMNLVRLAGLTGDRARRERAEAVVAGVLPVLAAQPIALPQMLAAMDALLASPSQAVIAAGDDWAAAGAGFRRVLYHPIG